MKYRFALLIVLACICSVLAEAKVKLPSVLSDGMVLQRERPIKYGERLIRVRMWLSRSRRRNTWQ